VVALDTSGSLIAWKKNIVGAQIIEDNSEFILALRQQFPPQQTARDLTIVVQKDQKHAIMFLGCVDSRVHLYSLSLLLSKLSVTHQEASNDATLTLSNIGVLWGHEDWVTCVTAIEVSCTTTLIASSSQDHKIRIWKMVSTAQQQQQAHPFAQQVGNGTPLSLHENDDDDDDNGDDIDAVALPTDEDDTFSDARLSFSLGGLSYMVYFDALCVGHEDFVTSVHWLLNDASSSDSMQGFTDVVGLNLFSTSMDRNMIIWQPDETSGVWLPSVRIGDIGGTLGGSVGGNLLGFVGGCVSPSHTALLGIGYGGSFHLWRRKLRESAGGATGNHQGEEYPYCSKGAALLPIDVAQGDSTSSSSQKYEGNHWQPQPFGSGHFAAVCDLAWAPDGSYLLSASSDQTCRLFAPLRQQQQQQEQLQPQFSPDKQETKWRRRGEGKWKEFSRPEIHGYNLNCVVTNPKLDTHTIYTAGDEKVLRTFDAPTSVLDGLQKLSCSDQNKNGISSGRAFLSHAFSPELGLTNKAVEMMSEQERQEMSSRNVDSLTWLGAPLEGQLADFTLWPETGKLFGHSNDVMCLTINHAGTYLASACKARNPETACPLMWALSTAAHGPRAVLRGHESTVVCLAFSPDDSLLASAGKDRSICLYRCAESSSSHCATLLVHPKAHRRIIWDLAWSPDGSVLGSVSRDGSFKLWTVASDESSSSSQLFCQASVEAHAGCSLTALHATLDLGQPSCSLWAIGCESGEISLWNHAQGSEKAPLYLHTTSSDNSHGSSIRCLRWRPLRNSASDTNTLSLQLASASDDHCIRVYAVSMRNAQQGSSGGIAGTA
jgi:elongator complex protein 2